MNSISKENKICAVIPFYNSGKTIGDVLSQTIKHVNVIFAIDDGSNDDYKTKLGSLNSSVINVISLGRNRGKGYALSRGFEQSIKTNSLYTITLDADLQHDPAFIPRFIDKLETYDIVIGNRLNDMKNMPPQRKLSNKLTSFMLSLKTRTKIIDSQCGFRAFKTSILKNIMPQSSGFEAESEILINAAKQGYKIGFIEIPTIYSSEKSKIKAVKTILGFIKILLFTNGKVEKH